MPTSATKPERPLTVKVNGGWRGYVVSKTGRLVEVFIPEKTGAAP